jgi:hypothetical protein
MTASGRTDVRPLVFLDTVIIAQKLSSLSDTQKGRRREQTTAK